MKLVVSNLAKEDLASIEDYTRKKWGNRQADKYLAQIENRMLSLLETPSLELFGRKCQRGTGVCQKASTLFFTE